MAIEHGHAGIVKELLKVPDIDIEGSSSYVTPFIKACANVVASETTTLKMIRMLIEAGVDVNAADEVSILWYFLLFN